MMFVLQVSVVPCHHRLSPSVFLWKIFDKNAEMSEFGYLSDSQ